MEQLRAHGGGPSHEDEGEILNGQVNATVQPIDALLDEIDLVLESNATQFVQGFVQKGGQ
ncbi:MULTISPECIES: ubiquitin-like protein Pup [unclassified Schaalia]|uniref:ubiquitin-like protein Pup n=1 Tax=unclassified Schaalia TaxID=2691889 RepID=UPI001E563219|nr:ubiquitin-like protein Pup [Schaalia sp. lx-260]MCD4558164.1 ubiquitin-like protein Pup [Schaalia sp. lx-100]